MATVKEIIQQFCYRINQPAPSAFIGVTSPTEAQYLSLFKMIGDNLRNRPFTWPQLKRGYTFTTVTDQSKYQLPGDFYRLLRSTEWDVTNQWPLLGPALDSEFTAREFGAIDVSTRKMHRIRGAVNYLFNTSPYNQRSQGWFEIDPAGQNSTDQLFLGYTSCNWIWPRDWVASTVYSAGAIRAGNGYVYRTAAGGTSGSTRPSHATGSASDGSVTWTTYTEPYLIGDTANTNLSDDDLCLFDEDLMIEGMRWAYLQATGRDYGQERQDWEMMVKSAAARFDGPCQISMIGDSETLYFNVPEGSWSV